MSYSPTLGRFLELDPIGTPNTAGLGQSQVVLDAEHAARDNIAEVFGSNQIDDRELWRYANGMNLYEFVQGNPVSKTDPSGLQVAKDGGPTCPKCNERWNERRAKALQDLAKNNSGLIGAGVGTAGGAGAVVWGVCASNPIGWIGGAVLGIASIGTGAYEFSVAQDAYREAMASADAALAQCEGKRCKK